jgi:hypothetical protein
MNDPLSGIRQIMPTYPSKPARPAGERGSGDRNRRPEEPKPESMPDDDETKPTIDEYI